MARITILGAGVCGLGTGLILARDGHDVTVLERDPAPIPKSHDDAWQGWTRSGVAQFRQPHYLHPRVLHILDAELPDVRDALVTAGAQRFDTLRSAPPSLPRFERRPDDARFVALTARRATLEHVIARVAATEPRVQVRRGVAVSALVTEAATRGGSGVSHVFGVRTDAGEELHADLVVDAMGRRSPLPRWLEAAGAAPLDEESEPSGFVYYTRYFHSKSGVSPDPRDRLLAPVGSLSILTLPGDNGTWSVTLFGSADDRPLTQLRHADRWMSVVAAFPLHAHWLEGEPLTDVLPMAGILDRRRRLAPHGQPVVTGLAVVADAWACTNPSLGRGISLGLLHATRLRDVVRTELADPRAFALAWDRVTETELTPWYRGTVAVDRARLADLDGARTGAERPRPSDPAGMLAVALAHAMAHDVEIFRAYMEIVGCLTLPPEVFGRPGFAERVLEVAKQHEVPPPPGPTRAELLRLIA